MPDLPPGNDPGPQSPAPSDWRRLHAYGWPAGSVRAFMALLVFGTLWGMLLVRPGMELPDYLRDVLFIILGHYFAVRGRAGAGEAPGPPPLYLPRGSIRLVLIAGFVATALVLYRQGRLLSVEKSPAAVTLLLVGGFLLGVVLHQFAVWWSGRGHPTPRLFEDVRATLSILAAVLLVAIVWDGFVPFLPQGLKDRILDRRLGLGHLGLPHLLAAIVGFYFGSRS
jgi:hypothetical protein